MTQRCKTIISDWFEGLEKSNLERLVKLFSPHPRICNAANPPAEGRDVARQLLTDFFTRTSARRFNVRHAAEGDGHVFAAWDGELTFRPGVRVADVTLRSPLTIQLRGVERFQLDGNGLIEQVDIIHETTTLPRAARAANP
jgi:hypothetical protein